MMAQEEMNTYNDLGMTTTKTFNQVMFVSHGMR